jgi:hypothetical protein
MPIRTRYATASWACDPALSCRYNAVRISAVQVVSPKVNTLCILRWKLVHLPVLLNSLGRWYLQHTAALGELPVSVPQEPHVPHKFALPLRFAVRASGQALQWAQGLNWRADGSRRAQMPQRAC